MIEPSIIPIPSALKFTQEWFASIITRPLNADHLIQDFTCRGALIAEETQQYVAPSPNLQPFQRMQIYNQQYWWRLLNNLHANFPMVTRLLGYCSFNQDIAVPYLIKHPPYHWSLNTLGEPLNSWLESHYFKADKKLVCQAAELDWAFLASFIAPHHPPLDLPRLLQESPNELLNHVFYLQPCLYLFSWESNLLAFRQHLLEHKVDFWSDHPLPELLKRQNYHLIIYRNQQNNISWKEIGQGELVLLERLKKGTTLNDAFEYLEKQNEEVYEEVATHLQTWLQEWAQMGWLTLTASNKN